MTRTVALALAVLAVSTTARAHTAADIVERALAAVPRQLRDAATVIRWKPDCRYDALKRGTNPLVCGEGCGHPGEQPFAAQCTSLGNLERVAS